MKPRVVEVEWLIGTRRLSKFSPLALISEKLKVKWMMLWEGYIYGPAPGITEALDLLITVLKPKSMLDLFCGSGALSKLAYSKGVEKIVSVDLYPDAALRNLRRCRGIKVIGGDALSLQLGEQFDLLVADPPEELVEKLLENLDRLRRLFRLAALIWLGPHQKAEQNIILLKSRRMVRILEAWGDTLAVLWKPGLGSRIASALRLLE